MSTFETIVAAHNAKDKAVADANAIAVPCDEFHAGDCIVWVRSRDRMLSIRYQGVNEIIAPESFAKDLRDILNGLFPVEADAVKPQDGAPKPPAKADEWPRVWLAPSKLAIRFQRSPCSKAMFVALDEHGKVEPSTVELVNGQLTSDHVRLVPETRP